MLKRLGMLVGGIMLSLTSFAQGIVFSHMSFEEAKAKARAENKGIFIDVYTSWCGPCKQMAAEVFPQKEVGDYFNANFICLKLDAEKEADHGFFKIYKATAYPTSVWLSSEGEIWNVEVGLLSVSSILDRAAKASQTKIMNKNAEYARRWESGERSLELLRNYVFSIVAKLHPENVRPYFESYLASLTPEQLQDPLNCRLMARYIGRKPEGFIFETVMKYHSQVEKSVGYLAFNEIMYRLVVRSANVAIINHQDSVYQQHIKLIKESAIPNKEMYLQIIAFETLLNQKKYKEGVTGMLAAAEKYGAQNPYLYQHFSYSLVSSGCLADAKLSKKQYEALIALTAKTFALSPSTKTITYLAAAYAKAGNYEKAYETELAAQFYPKDVLPGILIKNDLKRPINIETPSVNAEELKQMKTLIANKEAEKIVISRDDYSR